jgi:hypothetical protein
MTITGVTKRMTDVLQDGKFWGWVVGIVVATVTTLSWMNATFITRADANSLIPLNHVRVHDGLSGSIDALTEEVKETNTSMWLHMRRERLESVKREISANDSEIFAVQQFMDLNGKNAVSEARLRKLKALQNDLDLKMNCIISENGVCD